MYLPASRERVALLALHNKVLALRQSGAVILVHDVAPAESSALLGAGKIPASKHGGVGPIVGHVVIARPRTSGRLVLGMREDLKHCGRRGTKSGINRDPSCSL